MATFRHERTECQCVDRGVKRRIFWPDPGAPGRVYVYLSSRDAAGAAAQFSRCGILDEGELPGRGDDRISGVTFECDLPVMLENMLSFTDPPKEIAAWLLVLQHSANDLARNCSKSKVKEGPPPRF